MVLASVQPALSPAGQVAVRSSSERHRAGASPRAAATLLYVLLFVSCIERGARRVPGVLGVGETEIVKSGIDIGEPPFGIAVITAVNVCAP